MTQESQNNTATPDTQYQGIIVVLEPRGSLHGDYKPTYYPADIKEVFDRAVESGYNSDGELISDSRWLDEAVDRTSISEIGAEMAEHLYRSR